MFRIVMLFLLFSRAVLASDIKDMNGFTPYGYNMERLIQLYDGDDHEKGVALITFTHVFYSNYLAIEMIKKSNSNGLQEFFCSSKSAKKPTSEIELFISWAKLMANKDKSVLKDPITTLYPLYLADMYPTNRCGTNR